MAPGSSDPDDLIPGTLMERLGIAWVSAEAARVEATMPVEGNVQPFGFLHGGATSALIESAASLGATMASIDAERVAVCVDITVHHLRGVRGGVVTAIATPIRAGEHVQVWDVAVHDDTSRLVATGRCTFVFRTHGTRATSG